MKKKLALKLISLTLWVFVSYTECMDRPNERRLTLLNRTGESIIITASVDGREIIEPIAHNKNITLGFITINSLELIPADSLSSLFTKPHQYVEAIKADLEEQKNLMISINPPVKSNLFGINPYRLHSVFPIQTKGKPEIKKFFPAASTILTANPHAEITAAEILEIDPRSSLERIIDELSTRYDYWKHLSTQALTIEEKRLAEQVLDLLVLIGRLAKHSQRPNKENKSNRQEKELNEFTEKVDREMIRHHLLGTPL